MEEMTSMHRAATQQYLCAVREGQGQVQSVLLIIPRAHHRHSRDGVDVVLR